MKSPKISEIGLHRSVADFLSWTVLPPAVWTTFPAGWTAMRPGAAGRLKACGLKEGMPDILVFHDRRTFGIELKTEKGIVSPAQLSTFNLLEAAGIPVKIARSVDDVACFLLERCIPMRKVRYGYKTSASRRSPQPAQGASSAAP